MSFFYGWKISILSMAGNFMLQGASIYCMNAFMEPLCDIHGWSRMELNFSLGLAALMGQISMPLAAAIATRISLRVLMTLGAIAGGVATCAMGYTGNIYLFTLYLIIQWIASQFCGGVIANALMSNWFSHFRGIAFGIANSGTSLAGMCLPLTCLVIMDTFNMETAFLFLGVATCALGPLSWYVVRRTPQMLHLHPDGRKHEPRTAKNIPQHLSLKNLVARPAAWYMGIAFGLGLMCASGIISQLKPRFSDFGMDAYTGILLAALAATFGTLSKYFWGWLCDKISPVYACRLMMLFCFSSMLLLFLPGGKWTLAAFAICFATGSGGIWVLLPAVTAYYFGSSNFLSVYKFVTIFLLIRCLGFPIMGISHGNAGSYVLADIIFAGCLLIAFILTMLLHNDRAAENTHHKAHAKKGTH